MKAAVITARGGSKRVPRKNILDFHGKPMIAWSIEAAINANTFDRVLVSTDDAEIAGIAEKWGAEVPFVRPAELANDFATTADVMAHAVSWLDTQSRDYKSVCCIYPTAPFLVSQDIEAGYQALKSGEWKYAFSAAPFDSAVFRSFVQNSEGGIEMIFPDYYEARSQDLPIALYDAAQFYWGRKNAWLNKDKIFSDWSIPVNIPLWRVIDIDTPADLELARSRALEIYQRLPS